MKKRILTIMTFSIVMLFCACTQESNTCIGCQGPNLISAGTPYCEGQIFDDEYNLAPNYDGVTLTSSIMNDIVNNSNGSCQFLDMGSQD